MYLLLMDHYCEGWQVEKYKTLEEIIQKIKKGENYGSPFIVAKELDLKIGDDDVIDICP